MYIFIRTYTCMYIYTFTHIHIKHTCRCMYTYGHNYLILEMVRKANPEPLNVCSLSMPVSEQRKANTQERTKVGEVDGEGEKGEENKREGKEEVNRQGGSSLRCHGSIQRMCYFCLSVSLSVYI